MSGKNVQEGMIAGSLDKEAAALWALVGRTARQDTQRGREYTWEKPTPRPSRLLR